MRELPERATVRSASHRIADRHYLVTGAGGLIDSRLTDAILPRGGHVREPTASSHATHQAPSNETCSLQRSTRGSACNPIPSAPTRCMRQCRDGEEQLGPTC